MQPGASSTTRAGHAAPAVVPTLTLEGYIELHDALTKGSGHQVAQLNNLEAAWFKIKDINQVLALHGQTSSDRKKKELLDGMVGLQLYAPLPHLSGQRQGDLQQQQQGAGASNSQQQPMPAQPATRPAGPAAAGPALGGASSRAGSGRPPQGPALKQSRITAFCPVPVTPPPVVPLGVEAVRVEDLQALGWVTPSPTLTTALQQPPLVLRRPATQRGAPAAASEPAGTRTAADAQTAAQAAVPAAAPTRVAGGSMETATPAAPGQGTAGSQVPVATCLLGPRALPSSHTAVGQQQRGPTQPAATADVPPAGTAAGAPASTSAVLRPTPAVAGSSTAGLAVLATGPVSAAAPPEGRQAGVVGGANAAAAGRSEGAADRLQWLAGEVVRFSQEAGVVASSEVVAAPAQLLGRRVGFLTTGPMEHRDSGGRVEGVLPAALHQGAVTRRIGTSCRPDLCDTGCCGAHEWCAVRLLTPLDNARQHLELVLDLAARHRVLQLQGLLGLADHEDQLQDAWLLLKVRDALEEGSDAEEGGPGQRQQQAQARGGAAGSSARRGRGRGVKRPLPT